MTDPKFIETAMLLCFSAGWYASIIHMLRTGSAAGKSINFIVMITAGYALGCATKIVDWQATGTLSWVFYVYFWNGLICLTDLAIVLHLRRRSSTTAQATTL